MVTHEIVHVSDDLKHDAHLVKRFTERAEQVLQNNGVPIHKIIEFTDQAPSQYKNKTAFHYLTKRKTPVSKMFFGVRHGKSSCDACTGRVKQGVTRLVKTETAVVNSAKTFYDTCVEHLQKPLLQPCQHFILSFEFHNKLTSRLDTKLWPAIPKTRQFHCIGNMKNKQVYLRTFSCSCVGCIQGEEDCSNTVCPEEWKGYDLGSQKNCKANRSWWHEMAAGQIRKITENTGAQQDIDWVARLNVMNAINNFDDLATYVNQNPLPCFSDKPNDRVLQQELLNLDMVALHHIPNDAPQRVAPVSVEGDGNCFPQTISYLLYKSEQKYMEIRVRLVYEAILNINSYVDDIYVSVGARHSYDRATLTEQYAQYSDNFIPNTGRPIDVLDIYKKEVMDIRKDGAFMGIWQIFQAANVVKQPIHSVFPNIGNENVVKDLNRTVYCIDNANNIKPAIYIMWTPMQVKNSRPCHFVPLLQVVRNERKDS